MLTGLVIIAIGFPCLGRKTIPDQTRLPGEKEWSTSSGYFNTTIRRVGLSAVYIVFNSYIVIVTIIPPYQNPDGSPREIKGWIYFAAAAGTIVAGLIYYLAAFASSDWSLIRLARARAAIEVKDNHDATYGCRKYVKLTLKDPVRSPRIIINNLDKLIIWVLIQRHPSLLYRLFGGHLTGEED